MEPSDVFSIIKAAYESQAKLDHRLSSGTPLSGATVITGKGGLLDSMSIVAFILELEDRFQEPLLDEVMKAIQQRTAFTLGDLVDLIRRKQRG